MPRIAGIQHDSITNGVGVRDVIFLQGCPHHCKGCHNSETWNREGGYEISWKELVQDMMKSSNNLTISGGEPLAHRDFDTLIRFSHALGKDVWLYTGYTFESFSEEFWWQLCELGVSVVVDGRYEEELRDPDLLFRGSSNQRIIDLRKTLTDTKHEVILWETE